MLPDDNDIYSMLAGTLIQTGQAASAFVVYKTWGLTGGNAADYTGAIGSAMTANDRRQTAVWLREALSRWPNSAELLTLAGKDAAIRGEYDKAQYYWKAALEAMPNSESGLPLAGTVAGAPTAADQLGTLLLGGRATEADAASPAALGQLLAGNTFAAAGAPPMPSSQRAQQPWMGGANMPVAGAGIDTLRMPTNAQSSEQYITPYGALSRAGVVAPPPAALPKGMNPPVMLSQAIGTVSSNVIGEPQQMAMIGSQPRSARQEVEDQISAIETRNTPYIGSMGRMSTRSGRSGLETLTVQEAEFDASTTLGNKYRLSLIGRPVFLDAGVPEADTVLRFGLAPLGADIGNQSASGTGAELQFSGQSLGLKIGTTPNGFLVRNPTFGLRISPGEGPVTALLERDSVKDTLLSYAGTRDPVSKQIWGGVISDSITLKGDWGTADTGFYGQVGYQRLTGKGVASNSGMNGGAGAYWKLLTRPEGSLKMGLNFFTMHYE
jgi:hypothetical protein